VDHFTPLQRNETRIFSLDDSAFGPGI